MIQKKYKVLTIKDVRAISHHVGIDEQDIYQTIKIAKMFPCHGHIHFTDSAFVSMHWFGSQYLVYARRYGEI